MICRLCKLQLDENKFYLRKETNKRRTDCISCHSIERNKRRQKNRKQRSLKEKYLRLISPQFKLDSNLRRRIHHALKGTSKGDSTKELLGCSIEELKNYLQSKFKPGMTWRNYGKNGWHIDHIIPCKSFNLSDKNEQKKCFHYTNLQPLWALENLKKGTK